MWAILRLWENSDVSNFVAVEKLPIWRKLTDASVNTWKDFWNGAQIWTHLTLAPQGYNDKNRYNVWIKELNIGNRYKNVNREWTNRLTPNFMLLLFRINCTYVILIQIDKYITNLCKKSNANIFPCNKINLYKTYWPKEEIILRTQTKTTQLWLIIANRFEKLSNEEEEEIDEENYKKR